MKFGHFCLPTFFPDVDGDVGLLMRAADERLSGFTAREGGPELSTHVAAGNPGPTLVEMEKTLEADLVVAYTHGRTGFDHLMLGSVAEYLARRALGPVLVLPRAARS